MAVLGSRNDLDDGDRPRSLFVTMALIFAVTVIFVGATIAVSVVYGQSGSRLVKRLEENGDIIADNDEHWKAGIFYWNKDDASLILPKRFGAADDELGTPCDVGHRRRSHAGFNCLRSCLHIPDVGALGREAS